MNRIAGRGAAFVLPALAWLSACGEQPAPSTPSPRPVEAVVLERSDPSQRLRVPGIVRSWAEQDIAFEVAGRIGFVINEGEQVRGRWEEGGEVLVEGDVLARLDPAEFEAAVRAAEADLESALIQRDSAAPAELARAEARRVEASENLSRTETAFAQDAASELDFVRARAQFEVAEAEVAVARSGVRSASAAALRAEATLTQARLDLKNTEIRAPFGAEVSDRFEIVGGYATPGTRVLSLTMLDPIEIAVQVSAATARSIAPENLVRFYVGGIERPFSGKVLRKSTSADPGTQTFTITVIARNQIVDRPADGERVAERGVPVPSISLPHLELAGVPGPVFVLEEDVLRRDSGGWYVWAFEGWELDALGEQRPEELILRRVPVTPGEARLNYQGTFLARSLEPSGTVSPDQVLAAGVPDGARDGDRAFLSAPRWACRPGDVVRVDLGRVSLEPGFYVPEDAIVGTGESSARVYLVGEGSVARSVDVELGAAIDGLRGIRSPELDAAAGSRVITVGASGVADGERVSVLGEGG